MKMVHLKKNNIFLYAKPKKLMIQCMLYCVNVMLYYAVNEHLKANTVVHLLSCINFS